jgi:glycosyltransferase involved in cell wall biosynthesis
MVGVYRFLRKSIKPDGLRAPYADTSLQIVYCQKMRFPNSSAHALHCCLTAANFAAAGVPTVFFPGIPFTEAVMNPVGRTAPTLLRFFAGIGREPLPPLLHPETIGTRHKGLYGRLFRARLRSAVAQDGEIVCFASSVKEAGIALDMRRRLGKSDVRVVFEIHHLISRLKDGEEAKALYALEKRVFLNADLVVFNCTTLQNACAGCLPEPRAHVVEPLGYNERTIRPVRGPEQCAAAPDASGLYPAPPGDCGAGHASPPALPEPSELSGTVNLAYAGSLQQGKGVENLLHALALLENNFMLTVIGGAPEADFRFLLRLAEELHLTDRVRFTGQLEQTAIAGRLADCDIFVIPMNTEEDFFAPIKMYEAQGLALPIAATPMPSLRRGLKDGVNALFAGGTEPGDLAALLWRLAAEPDLRRSMRRNNAAASRKLSAGARAVRLLARMRELFSAPAGNI